MALGEAPLGLVMKPFSFATMRGVPVIGSRVRTPWFPSEPRSLAWAVAAAALTGSAGARSALLRTSRGARPWSDASSGGFAEADDSSPVGPAAAAGAAHATASVSPASQTRRALRGVLPPLIRFLGRDPAVADDGSTVPRALAGCWSQAADPADESARRCYPPRGKMRCIRQSVRREPRGRSLRWSI